MHMGDAPPPGGGADDGGEGGGGGGGGGGALVVAGGVYPPPSQSCLTVWETHGRGGGHCGLPCCALFGAAYWEEKGVLPFYAIQLGAFFDDFWKIWQPADVGEAHKLDNLLVTQRDVGRHKYLDRVAGQALVLSKQRSFIQRMWPRPMKKSGNAAAQHDADKGISALIILYHRARYDYFRGFSTAHLRALKLSRTLPRVVFPRLQMDDLEDPVAHFAGPSAPVHHHCVGGGGTKGDFKSLLMLHAGGLSAAEFYDFEEPQFCDGTYSGVGVKIFAHHQPPPPPPPADEVDEEDPVEEEDPARIPAYEMVKLFATRVKAATADLPTVQEGEDDVVSIHPTHDSDWCINRRVDYASLNGVEKLAASLYSQLSSTYLAACSVSLPDGARKKKRDVAEENKDLGQRLIDIYVAGAGKVDKLKKLFVETFGEDAPLPTGGEKGLLGALREGFKSQPKPKKKKVGAAAAGGE
jgi:hypothetical protein